MKKLSLILGAVSMLSGIQAAHATVTTYNVTQTYNQVVYDMTFPDADTIFTGSFSFDSVSQTVSNFTGSLTQAMVTAAGGTSAVPLMYQLSSMSDGMGGLLVSLFAQDTTDVFLGGGYATGGTTTFGNNNAYVTIDINLADPTADLTDAQVAMLSYADCTPGSLMGMGASKTKCMTGWVKDTAGVPGAGGTMMGTYPISQTITAAVPEPETYAMMLAGLGLLGFMARKRKAG